MILSQKSLNFARKILKYNPKIDHHKNNQQTQTHNHQICRHAEDEKIKPFLHVHDHRKEREIFQKSTEQKLQNMKIFKEQGNQHFQNQKFQQASYFYNRIIIYADYTFPQTQKQQKQMDQLLQQANFKLNQYKKAIQYFIQAIKGPSSKLIKKGYYWLVKCNLNVGELQKAKQLFQKYKSLVSEDKNSQIQDLQRQIKKAQQDYKNKSKNLFGQIFSTNLAT